LGKYFLDGCDLRWEKVRLEKFAGLPARLWESVRREREHVFRRRRRHKEKGSDMSAAVIARKERCSCVYHTRPLLAAELQGRKKRGKEVGVTVRFRTLMEYGKGKSVRYPNKIYITSR